MFGLVNAAASTVTTRWPASGGRRVATAALVLGPSIFAVLACLPLLTKHPAPGGDEPGFVDVAVTLANKGFMGTKLFSGLLPGIEHHVYFQPPLYFVALAAWFRVFGAGLLQARVFSVLCGGTIVLAVHLIARRYATARSAVVAAMLCAASFWLIRSSCGARPDAMCVALTALSLFAYQKALDLGKRSLFLTVGVLCGLSALAHPLGLIAFASVGVHSAIRLRRGLWHDFGFLFIVGAFASCLLLWVPYIAQDPVSFQLQMVAQLARKRHQAPYWYQFWWEKTHLATLLTVLVAAAWLSSVGWRRCGGGALAVGLVVAFSAATYGHEAPYVIYYVPLMCAAIAVALDHVEIGRGLLRAGLAVSFLNEAAIVGNNIRRYRHRDYGVLASALRSVIPPGKSVFSIADQVTPYFALRGRNPMRVAIPVPLPEPGLHARVAAASDYIVVPTPGSYLPEVDSLIRGLTPVAVVSQADFRLAVFSRAQYAGASRKGPTGALAAPRGGSAASVVGGSHARP